MLAARGGFEGFGERGRLQREIQEAAYQYQRAVEKQDAIVVGVNKFQSNEIEPIPIMTIDASVEPEQVERVRAVRARRDAEKANAAIASLQQAASGTENLLPRILTCVESDVTVGEISHSLRKVWGEYREAVTV